tara:strand:+ start:854 stop:1237 length:384 start_codon:yes stop_codon:yes gene_type:complete
MLFVLGLLTTNEVWEILVLWAFVIAAAIVAIVYSVSPWVCAETTTKALCLLVLWKALPFLPGWPPYFLERARDDVYEPRTEVEDFRVVLEGQVVGEARRAQHALVAQVQLGSLGQFTFTLVPASRDG